MSIRDIVDKHIKKYNTNDPFEIAQHKNIEIIKQDLGDVKGFYQYFKRKKMIYLNYSLSDHEQRIVCSHELGHAILHPRLNVVFLELNTYFTKNKFEIEANKFAAELLINEDYIDKFVLENMSIEQISNYFEVPKELVLYKFS